jgi:hypothetical protein
METGMSLFTLFLVNIFHLLKNFFIILLGEFLLHIPVILGSACVEDLILNSRRFFPPGSTAMVPLNWTWKLPSGYMGSSCQRINKQS